MSGSNEELSSNGRLVFLVSQPRAGSTLLQRMLVRHPEIHSESETWILLRPLFGLDDDGSGSLAPYNARVEHQALREFLKTLPGGETDYFEACRRMYGHLYSTVLNRVGSSVFLDKTPRYYEILPEIMKVFPDARFIVLFRNPLAVFRSVWRTFGAGQWTQMQQFRRDLFRAPDALATAIDVGNSRVMALRFEDLISDPSEALGGICRFLDLPDHEGMVDYGSSGLDRWSLGDPDTVYRRKKVDSAHADLWVRDLANPQFWRACSEYLDILGTDLLARMGYSSDDLRAQLEAFRPSRMRRQLTVSLDCLMREDVVRVTRKFGRRLRCGLASRLWGIVP